MEPRDTDGSRRPPGALHAAEEQPAQPGDERTGEHVTLLRAHEVASRALGDDNMTTVCVMVSRPFGQPYVV